jgi:hypothetical protein
MYVRRQNSTHRSETSIALADLRRLIDAIVADDELSVDEVDFPQWLEASKAIRMFLPPARSTDPRHPERWRHHAR